MRSSLAILSIPVCFLCVYLVPSLCEALRRTRSTLYTRLLLERVDQAIRTAIMASTLSTIFQFRLNLLCQDLTKLNTPLVEAVDVPNGTFCEGDVLVIGDQSPQRSWGNLLREDRGRGSVSEESFVVHKLVRSSFGLDLCFRFARHERFRLGKIIGRQHPGYLVSVRPHNEEEIR